MKNGLLRDKVMRTVRPTLEAPVLLKAPVFSELPVPLEFPVQELRAVADCQPQVPVSQVLVLQVPVLQVPVLRVLALLPQEESAVCLERRVSVLVSLVARVARVARVVRGAEFHRFFCRSGFSVRLGVESLRLRNRMGSLDSSVGSVRQESSRHRRFYPVRPGFVRCP